MRHDPPLQQRHPSLPLAPPPLVDDLEAEVSAPRIIDKPQPGYFKLRLVKGGPWVAACIIHEPTRDPATGELLDRSWYWRAEIDGEPVADPAIDPHEAGVDRVWIFGRPITQQEHDYLRGVARWAREQQPAAPEAKPREAIDLLTAPIPF